MKAHHFSASRLQSMSRQNFPSLLIDHFPGDEVVLDIAKPYFCVGGRSHKPAVRLVRPAPHAAITVNMDHLRTRHERAQLIPGHLRRRLVGACLERRDDRHSHNQFRKHDPPPSYRAGPFRLPIDRQTWQGRVAIEIIVGPNRRPGFRMRIQAGVEAAPDCRARTRSAATTPRYCASSNSEKPERSACARVMRGLRKSASFCR